MSARPISGSARPRSKSSQRDRGNIIRCHATTRHEPQSLDPARLRSYLREQGIKTDAPRLRSLELLAEYAGDSVVASNAGLILFGKDRSRRTFVPDARVRCARFRGTTKAEILDQIDIRGTVLDAITDVEAFVARNTRTGARFSGGMRRENLTEYASVTVRELLLNAIAHTDYALTGAEILVSIFDDRLEIQIPARSSTDPLWRHSSRASAAYATEPSYASCAG